MIHKLNLLPVLFGTAFSWVVSVPASAQWAQVAGIEGGRVHSLSAINGAAHCTGASAGIFRADAGGTVWGDQSIELTAKQVLAVQGKGAYALALTVTDGILFSNDSMATWSPSTGLPSGTTVQQILLLDSIAYASTYDGFYRSTDHGSSWSLRSTEDHAPFTFSEGRLIGGDYMSGIRVSDDEGTSWTDANAGLPEIIIPGGQVRHLGPTNIHAQEGVLFISTDQGLFRSNDNGNSWAIAAFDGLPVQYVTGGIDTLAVALSGNSNGLRVSVDDGSSWTTTLVGNNHEETECLLLLNGRIYAGTDNGIFSSTDLGATWQRGEGLVNNSFNSIAADVSTIVIGASGVDQSGLMYSSDQGATWQQAAGTSPKYGAPDVAVHQGNWFANVNLSGMNTGSGSNGVYRSMDGAQTWEQVHFYPWEGLASSGTYLFGGTTGGVMRSANGGDGWEAVNTGFGYTNMFINCFATDGGTLYAGSMNYGVYRSTDLGQTWTPASSGVVDEDVRSLAVHNGTVFASTMEDGVYRSDDQGENWYPVNAGLPADPFVRSMLSVDGLLIAAVFGHGVYVSGDLGAYWYPANDGLYDPDVSGLAVQGDTVYVTTWGSGVFKASATYLDGTVGIEAHAPVEGAAVSVYPNPCEGTTHVAFTLASPAKVRIQLLDALGREVTDAWQGDCAQGRHVLPVKIPVQGVVLVRITVDGQMVIRQVVNSIR